MMRGTWSGEEQSGGDRRRGIGRGTALAVSERRNAFEVRRLGGRQETVDSWVPNSFTEGRREP